MNEQPPCASVRSLIAPTLRVRALVWQGEYAVSFVHGLEHAEEDTTHLQASACCKHYVANSMENTTVAGETHTRHDFDAAVTSQDLVDSYMLPFQSCVEKGGVSALMCSYNAVNGVPSEFP